MATWSERRPEPTSVACRSTFTPARPITSSASGASRPGGALSKRYHANPPIPTTAISATINSQPDAFMTPPPGARRRYPTRALTPASGEAILPDLREPKETSDDPAAPHRPAPPRRYRRQLPRALPRQRGRCAVGRGPRSGPRSGPPPRDRGIRSGRVEPAAARVAERGALVRRYIRAARARVPRDRFRALGGADRRGDRGAGSR